MSTKEKVEEIIAGAIVESLTIEEASERILALLDVSNSFAWDEVEEFGRKAFYDGREVEKYDYNGYAIFKRPTYNGYLRELDSK